MNNQPTSILTPGQLFSLNVQARQTLMHPRGTYKYPDFHDRFCYIPQDARP